MFFLVQTAQFFFFRRILGGIVAESTALHVAPIAFVLLDDIVFDGIYIRTVALLLVLAAASRQFRCSNA